MTDRPEYLSDEQVIANADAWVDAYWNGTLSPHGDHGPIIAVIERLRANHKRIAELEAALADADTRIGWLNHDD